MLYFMKPLPENKIDTTDWKPGVWLFSNTFIKVGLFVCIYVIHEFLHMIVIYKAGDIGITHSGIFLWITSGAILNKLRFFVFMSLPFIGLTVVPAILSVFLSGELKDTVVYVAWVNSMIAGADIINSVLIAVKPNNSLFYRGYYKTNF